MASIALREYPEAREMDSVRVAISRGFDIGIARGQSGRVFEGSPSEWLGGSVTQGVSLSGAYGESPIDREAALAFSDSYVGALIASRKPLRKFWYAVRTDRAEKGSYYQFVEVVPDGEGLACTSTAIVSFPMGAPDSFR